MFSLTPAEETAPQANVQTATVETQKACKTSLLGAPNTAGTKPAANVSFPTKVEVTPMLSTTTLTDQLMLASGRSTTYLKCYLGKLGTVQ